MYACLYREGERESWGEGQEESGGGGGGRESAGPAWNQVQGSISQPPDHDLD